MGGLIEPDKSKTISTGGSTSTGSSSSSGKKTGSSSSDGSKTDKSKTSSTDKTKTSSSSSSATDKKTTSSSSSATDKKPASSSDPNTKKVSNGGSSRLLSVFSEANPKVNEIDMLSDLSPVCKSIVLGRVYKSKYSDVPTKTKIKNSGLDLTKFT